MQGNVKEKPRTDTIFDCLSACEKSVVSIKEHLGVKDDCGEAIASDLGTLSNRINSIAKRLNDLSIDLASIKDELYTI